MKCKFKVKLATAGAFPGLWNKDGKVYLKLSGLSKYNVDIITKAIRDALLDLT